MIERVWVGVWKKEGTPVGNVPFWGGEQDQDAVRFHATIATSLCLADAGFQAGFFKDYLLHDVHDSIFLITSRIMGAAG